MSTTAPPLLPRRPLVGLLLAGVLTAFPLAAQAPPTPAPTDDDEYRRVKTFDFDERPLGNYEDVPMYWQALEGPAMPSFSRGEFDFEVGHDAAPSFRFDLHGGNICYEYDHRDLVIFPDSDYLIDGYIRTVAVEHARAFIASFLIDRFGNLIPSSQRVSELVGGAEDTGWRRVQISVPGEYPEARRMRLQLWLLQEYVWKEPPGHAIAPIIRQSVTGQAWFDDITVHRMPRVRFGLSNPGGIIRPGATESIELDVHNATLAPARAQLEVHDRYDEIHLAQEFIVAPQVTEQHRIPLPELSPGLYHARVQLVAAGEVLLERQVQFAVLPGLGARPTHRPDTGVDIGPWQHSDGNGAFELITALDVGAIKLGIPMIGTVQTEFDRTFFTQTRDFARRLALRNIRATGVILSPHADGESGARSPTWHMVASDPSWPNLVGPVFAYFGGYLMSWQLGYEETELAAETGWTPALIQQIQSKLEQFIAAPELIVTRSTLDVSPATLIGGPRATDQGPRVPATTNLMHAVSYWLPATVPARSVPWQLAFWLDAENVDASGSARRTSAQRWLSVDFVRDESLTVEQRVADFARRTVLAKAVDPDRLFVPAPFELTTTAGTPTWQPTYEYIPLRTLLHHLSGQRAVAALVPEQDAVAILFAGDSGHTLFIWSWRAGTDEQTVGLYLGAHARGLRLSGAEQPLDHDGAYVTVPLTSEPLIIEDIDAPLLLLQASFGVSPNLIQLHDPEPRPRLRLTNHFGVPLVGTLLLTPPATWAVKPTPISIEVAPGAEYEVPLDFTIPPRQVASTQVMGVDLLIRQPDDIDLHFEAKLKVELRDIIVRGSAFWDGDDLVVEQTLHNLSPTPVSFNAFCQADRRAMEEGVFLDVPPGDVRVQKYRFRRARELAGTRLWMGIQEIDGRRTLSKVVEVPH
jgi:hypothetical protein